MFQMMNIRRSDEIPTATATTAYATVVEDDDVEKQHQKRTVSVSAPPMPPARLPVVAVSATRPKTTPSTRLVVVARRLPCMRKHHLRCMYHLALCLFGVGILVAGIVCLVDAARRGVHIEHRTKHTHHPGLFPRDDDEVITTCHGDGCHEHYWAALVLLPLGSLSTLIVMCVLGKVVSAAYERLEE